MYCVPHDSFTALVMKSRMALIVGIDAEGKTAVTSRLDDEVSMDMPTLTLTTFVDGLLFIL